MKNIFRLIKWNNRANKKTKKKKKTDKITKKQNHEYYQTFRFVNKIFAYFVFLYSGHKFY